MRMLRFAALLAAYLICWPVWAAGLPLLRIDTIQSEPFGYRDQRGTGGMMYEIGNLIAETAGIPYQNRVVPYARTVANLRDGHADMVLRFGNPELTQVATQVAPVVAMPVQVFTLAGREVNSIAALRGKTVAVARSFPLDRRISAEPAIRLYLVDNNEHGVRMLFAGRVDALIGSDFGVLGAIRHLQRKPEDLGPTLPLEQQYFWLHLSRRVGDPAIADRLKTAVETLQQQGAIQRIWQTYLPTTTKP